MIGEHKQASVVNYVSRVRMGSTCAGLQMWLEGLQMWLEYAQGYNCGWNMRRVTNVAVKAALGEKQGACVIGAHIVVEASLSAATNA